MKFVLPFLMFLLLTSTLTIAEETAPGVLMPSHTATPPATTETPPPGQQRSMPQPSYIENGRPVYVDPKEKHIDCSEEKNRKLRKCRYN